jgi:putative hydrolase of the HAD superfamily
MSLIIDRQTCIVFDLDDTLYKEVEFVKSAYRHISKLILPYTGCSVYEEMFQLYRTGKNALDIIKEEFDFPYSIKELVYEYRYHKPTLEISKEVSLLLKCSKDVAGKVGLLTDGRSVTQRNKIAALGITHYFDDIRISEETGCEKPAEQCFTYFQNKYPELHQFIYVGDNLKKDFVTPNKLNWKTCGVKMNEWNIHKQDLSLDICYHPSIWIEDITKLITITTSIYM